MSEQELGSGVNHMRWNPILTRLGVDNLADAGITDPYAQRVAGLAAELPPAEVSPERLDRIIDASNDYLLQHPEVDPTQVQVVQGVLFAWKSELPEVVAANAQAAQPDPTGEHVGRLVGIVRDLTVQQQRLQRGMARSVEGVLFRAFSADRLTSDQKLSGFINDARWAGKPQNVVAEAQPWMVYLEVKERQEVEHAGEWINAAVHKKANQVAFKAAVAENPFYNGITMDEIGHVFNAPGIFGALSRYVHITESQERFRCADGQERTIMQARSREDLEVIRTEVERGVLQGFVQDLDDGELRESWTTDMASRMVIAEMGDGNQMTEAQKAVYERDTRVEEQRALSLLTDDEKMVLQASTAGLVRQTIEQSLPSWIDSGLLPETWIEQAGEMDVDQFLDIKAAEIAQRQLGKAARYLDLKARYADVVAFNMHYAAGYWESATYVWQGNMRVRSDYTQHGDLVHSKTRKRMCPLDETIVAANKRVEKFATEGKLSAWAHESIGGQQFKKVEVKDERNAGDWWKVKGDTLIAPDIYPQRSDVQIGGRLFGSAWEELEVGGRPLIEYLRTDRLPDFSEAGSQAGMSDYSTTAGRIDTLVEYLNGEATQEETRGGFNAWGARLNDVLGKLALRRSDNTRRWAIYASSGVKKGSGSKPHIEGGGRVKNVTRMIAKATNYVSDGDSILFPWDQ